MRFLADPDFWNILSSVATVLGFAVVIYTTVVALGQLKEMTRARHLEAMLQVYEMIGSEEARKHRKYVYTE
jgi:peroxiredoxin family protein